MVPSYRTIYKLRLYNLIISSLKKGDLYDTAVANVHKLARAIGKDDGYVSRIIRLTLLSPEIIYAIIAGTLEKDIGIEQLKQAMPLMWDDQKKMFGIE